MKPWNGRRIFKIEVNFGRKNETRYPYRFNFSAIGKKDAVLTGGHDESVGIFYCRRSGGRYDETG